MNDDNFEMGASLETPVPPRPSGVATKLANVMRAVGAIEKDGEHGHHHYLFTSADAVFDAVRGLLGEQCVAILPIMGNIDQQVVDKQLRTRIWFNFQFIDGESGEILSVPWCSEADDTGDKGISKTATYALKSLLRTMFLLSFDDNNSGGTRKSGNRAQQPQPPQPNGKSEPKAQPVDGDTKTFICNQLMVTQTGSNMQYVARCEGGINIVVRERKLYRAALVDGVEDWDKNIPKSGKLIEFKPALELVAKFSKKLRGWELDKVRNPARPESTPPPDLKDIPF